MPSAGRAGLKPEELRVSTGYEDDTMSHRDVQSRSRSQRSALSECLFRLKQLLKQFGKLDSELAGRISDATLRARWEVLCQAFKLLHALGYTIRKPQNFTDTLMRILAKSWEQQKLSASTLQKRFSTFRVFCIWIGKAGMVGDIEGYFSDPTIARRTYVAKKDKSWVAHGIDIDAKLNEVFAHEQHVGIQLLMQREFGGRAQEMWQIKPALADQGNSLMMRWGTKSGRPRTVPIHTDQQRKVLDLAKQYANPKTGSLIPAQYSVKAWKSHFEPPPISWTPP
jgi:site-specific recombinase XerC